MKCSLSRVGTVPRDTPFCPSLRHQDISVGSGVGGNGDGECAYFLNGEEINETKRSVTPYLPVTLPIFILLHFPRSSTGPSFSSNSASLEAQSRSPTLERKEKKKVWRGFLRKLRKKKKKNIIKE